METEIYYAQASVKVSDVDTSGKIVYNETVFCWA